MDEDDVSAVVLGRHLRADEFAELPGTWRDAFGGTVARHQARAYLAVFLAIRTQLRALLAAESTRRDDLTGVLVELVASDDWFAAAVAVVAKLARSGVRVRAIELKKLPLGFDRGIVVQHGNAIVQHRVAVRIQLDHRHDRHAVGVLRRIDAAEQVVQSNVVRLRHLALVDLHPLRQTEAIDWRGRLRRLDDDVGADHHAGAIDDRNRHRLRNRNRWGHRRGDAARHRRVPHRAAQRVSVEPSVRHDAGIFARRCADAEMFAAAVRVARAGADAPTRFAGDVEPRVRLPHRRTMARGGGTRRTCRHGEPGRRIEVCRPADDDAERLDSWRAELRDRPVAVTDIAGRARLAEHPGDIGLPDIFNLYLEAL